MITSNTLEVIKKCLNFRHVGHLGGRKLVAKKNIKNSHEKRKFALADLFRKCNIKSVSTHTDSPSLEGVSSLFGLRFRAALFLPKDLSEQCWPMSTDL